MKGEKNKLSTYYLLAILYTHSLHKILSIDSWHKKRNDEDKRRNRGTVKLFINPCL